MVNLSPLQIFDQLLVVAALGLSAANKATRLIGSNVMERRNAVLETLPSTLGCTHLRDVLRALADVPVLAAQL